MSILRRSLLWASAALLLMIPFAYWMMLHGAPYARAERFVADHPAIESRIGRVTGVRLAFDWDELLGFPAPEDSAHLELVVTGEHGSGFATLELRRERGYWNIVSARFRRQGERVPVDMLPIGKPPHYLRVATLTAN